eukprot:TRINITY_DN3617_c0_g2_i1.p1 TRINITY_DN3617_c0_g2~~TRINITY_DN3617_c0_g2_i1.p1  ORF type:complete len:658 (-),score=107.54 TRINITY_DN3617_c0_g2_i1:152-2125(-)
MDDESNGELKAQTFPSAGDTIIEFGYKPVHPFALFQESSDGRSPLQPSPLPDPPPQRAQLLKNGLAAFSREPENLNYRKSFEVGEVPSQGPRRPTMSVRKLDNQREGYEINGPMQNGRPQVAYQRPNLQQEFNAGMGQRQERPRQNGPAANERMPVDKGFVVKYESSKNFLGGGKTAEDPVDVDIFSEKSKEASRAQLKFFEEAEQPQDFLPPDVRYMRTPDVRSILVWNLYPRRDQPRAEKISTRPQPQMQPQVQQQPKPVDDAPYSPTASINPDRSRQNFEIRPRQPTVPQPISSNNAHIYPAQTPAKPIQGPYLGPQANQRPIQSVSNPKPNIPMRSEVPYNPQEQINRAPSYPQQEKEQRSVPNNPAQPQRKRFKRNIIPLSPIMIKGDDPLTLTSVTKLIQRKFFPGDLIKFNEFIMKTEVIDKKTPVATESKEMYSPTMALSPGKRALKRGHSDLSDSNDEQEGYSPLELSPKRVLTEEEQKKSPEKKPEERPLPLPSLSKIVMRPFISPYPSNSTKNITPIVEANLYDPLKSIPRKEEQKGERQELRREEDVTDTIEKMKMNSSEKFSTASTYEPSSIEKVTPEIPLSDTKTQPSSQKPMFLAKRTKAADESDSKKKSKTAQQFFKFSKTADIFNSVLSSRPKDRRGDMS